MPRSASTLQFNLTWKVVEGAGAGSRVDWRTPAEWQVASDELRAMVHDKGMHVVKMHFPPDNVRRIAEESDRVRYVYVHRDIRDVVYSMKVKFSFSLSHALNRVSDALQIEQWLIERKPEHVLVQDYPLLLRELSEATDQIANFLNVEIEQQLKSAILSELNVDIAYQRSRQKKIPFEHLRRRINRLLGRRIAFADDQLMLHPRHVSEHKGEIGVWEKGLSPEEIEAIRQRFANRVHDGFKVQ
jgi:hypothetical protein